MIDDNGMIWLGSDGGLDLINPKQGQFVTYGHVPDETNGGARLSVHALCGDRDGYIWAGTGDVLSRLDPASGEIKKFPIEIKALDLPPSEITALYCDDSENGIWFGLNANPNLHFFNRSTGRIEIHETMGGQPPPGPPPEMTAFAADSRGGLYFLMDHYGLFRFDRKKKTFTSFTVRPGSKAVNDPGRLADGRVAALLMDRQGFLWIGSPNGILSRLDTAAGDFKHYLPSPDGLGGIPDYWIEDMYEDREGRIWMATHGGLVLFDRSREALTVFGEEKRTAGRYFVQRHG